MNLESLLIDIQTILNMLRFNSEFNNIFLKNPYVSNDIAFDIKQYSFDVNMDSKNRLWEFCSTAEHIVEINKSIEEWRKITPNFESIEEELYLTHEKPYSHDIVGKIVKTNNRSENSKALMAELINNKFYYNGMSIIVSQAINNTNNSRLHFFY